MISDYILYDLIKTGDQRGMNGWKGALKCPEEPMVLLWVLHAVGALIFICAVCMRDCTSRWDGEGRWLCRWIAIKPQPGWTGFSPHLLHLSTLSRGGHAQAQAGPDSEQASGCCRQRRFGVSRFLQTGTTELGQEGSLPMAGEGNRFA